MRKRVKFFFLEFDLRWVFDGSNDRSFVKDTTAVASSDIWHLMRSDKVEESYVQVSQDVDDNGEPVFVLKSESMNDYVMLTAGALYYGDSLDQLIMIEPVNKGTWNTSLSEDH